MPVLRLRRPGYAEAGKVLALVAGQIEATGGSTACFVNQPGATTHYAMLTAGRAEWRPRPYAREFAENAKGEDFHQNVKWAEIKKHQKLVKSQNLCDFYAKWLRKTLIFKVETKHFEPGRRKSAFHKI